MLPCLQSLSELLCCGLTFQTSVALYHFLVEVVVAHPPPHLGLPGTASVP